MYIPNRHAVIFNELLYSPDIVQASLFIRLYRLPRNDKPKGKNYLRKMSLLSSKNNLVQLENITPKNSNNPEVNLFLQTQQNNPQLIEIEVEDKVRMIVEIHKNGELLYKDEGYNSIKINHFVFEGIPTIIEKNPRKGIDTSTQPMNVPYNIFCYLDMSEMPRTFKSILSCNDIYWGVRFCSSDTLVLVKDSSKEDMENSIKESWETFEPGRSDKAKKSRLKFLIQSKKDNGKVLTKDEELLVNEERERKFLTAIQETESKTDRDRDKKKKLIKLDPTQVKKAKDLTPTPVIHRESLNFNKPLPAPDSHCSFFIKQFLNYTFQNRTVVNDQKVALSKIILLK